MPFILIAEDDRSTLDAMTAHLRARGYRVGGAVTAERALDTAEDRPPDLVISDWNLGQGMDGLDLARRLRGIGCQAPVLFVTGLPLEQMKSRAGDLANVSFLQKPATLTTLTKLVGKLLLAPNSR